MKRGGPSGPPLYSLEVETEHTEHFAVSNVYHGDFCQKIVGMT